MADPKNGILLRTTVALIALQIATIGWLLKISSDQAIIKGDRYTSEQGNLLNQRTTRLEGKISECRRRIEAIENRQIVPDIVALRLMEIEKKLDRIETRLRKAEVRVYPAEPLMEKP
jgi:hypothetical protein